MDYRPSYQRTATVDRDLEEIIRESNADLNSPCAVAVSMAAALIVGGAVIFACVESIEHGRAVDVANL